MLHRVFSVRDNAAEAYLQPFFSVNRATALRALREAVRDVSHTFAKYPSQYGLFYLGTFDDQTCVFTLESTPVSFGLLSDLVGGYDGEAN